MIVTIKRFFNQKNQKDCPECIYTLMLSCWSKEKNTRPAFGEIVLTLDRLIKNSEIFSKKKQKDATNSVSRFVQG